MNMQKLLFPSLLVFAVLALRRRLFAKPASAETVSNSTSHDGLWMTEPVDGG